MVPGTAAFLPCALLPCALQGRAGQGGLGAARAHFPLVSGPEPEPPAAPAACAVPGTQTPQEPRGDSLQSLELEDFQLPWRL